MSLLWGLVITVFYSLSYPGIDAISCTHLPEKYKCFNQKSANLCKVDKECRTQRDKLTHGGFNERKGDLTLEEPPKYSMDDAGPQELLHHRRDKKYDKTMATAPQGLQVDGSDPPMYKFKNSVRPAVGEGVQSETVPMGNPSPFNTKIRASTLPSEHDTSAEPSPMQSLLNFSPPRNFCHDLAERYQCYNHATAEFCRMSEVCKLAWERRARVNREPEGPEQFEFYDPEVQKPEQTERAQIILQKIGVFKPREEQYRKMEIEHSQHDHP